MAATRKKQIDVEKTIQELETLVEQLESGELSLDKSLKNFEKGIKLSRDCQAALGEAEQKVQILMSDELKALDPDELDSN